MNNLIGLMLSSGEEFNQWNSLELDVNKETVLNISENQSTDKLTFDSLIFENICCSNCFCDYKFIITVRSAVFFQMNLDFMNNISQYI